MSVAALNHTQWLDCNACSVLQKREAFQDSFHIVIIPTGYELLHLLAGASHRLLPLSLAAWTPLCLLPLAAWRRVGGELTPSSPCGRACKCKDSFSAYYLSDSGFWCLPLSVRVCVCVCWREKRDKERESEGEASSVSSPPFSLPVSLLPVTPSFLPSPGPPSSPASSRTETPLPPRPPQDPLTLLTSPSHQHLSAGLPLLSSPGVLSINNSTAQYTLNPLPQFI